jgi:hypothetical protein
LAWPGLRSKVSIWLGPPFIHNRMHERRRRGSDAAPAASASSQPDRDQPATPALQGLPLPRVADEGQGEQVADHAVVGDVVGELPAQPGVQVGQQSAALKVGGGLGRQQLEPEVGEVAGVGRAVQQFVDGAFALVGSTVGEEAAHVADGGDAAGDVQVQAAQEGGVVGRRGRLHALLGPAGGDQLVDALRQALGGGAAGRRGGLRRQRRRGPDRCQRRHPEAKTGHGENLLFFRCGRGGRAPGGTGQAEGQQDRGQAEQDEPAGQGRAAPPAAVHDEGEAALEEVGAAETAGGRGQHPDGRGLGQEVHRLEQGAGIVGAGRGQLTDHPGVAAFLLRGAQPAAAVPHQRIPPVQSGGQPLQRPHPMIAAAQVGQFVDQQGGPALGAETPQEVARKVQACSPADRPDQGRHRPGQQPDGRTAAQPHAAGQRLRLVLQGRGRRRGEAEQAMEAGDAPCRQDEPARGPAQPHDHQQAGKHRPPPRLAVVGGGRAARRQPAGGVERRGKGECERGWGVGGWLEFRLQPVFPLRTG